MLFDELKIIPERQKKTAGGARSTRESELEKIRDANPIIADILEYRELKKLLSTYIENLPPLLDAEHRLHAEFIQTGTTTGRMAIAESESSKYSAPFRARPSDTPRIRCAEGLHARLARLFANRTAARGDSLGR